MADILIIDDDRLVRESLGQVVEKMGHKASRASSASEGLEKGAFPGFRRRFLRRPDARRLGP